MIYNMVSEKTDHAKLSLPCCLRTFQRIRVEASKLIWYCWTSRRLLTKSVTQSSSGNWISMRSEEMHYPGSMPSWVSGHRLWSSRVKNQGRFQWPMGYPGISPGVCSVSCIYKRLSGWVVIANTLICWWHSRLSNSRRLGWWNSATKWPGQTIYVGEPVGHGVQPL